MARLETRSAVARLAGVSATAITKACTKGKLQAAVRGKFVDLDHPAARDYLEAKGVDPGQTLASKKGTSGASKPSAGRPRKGASGGKGGRTTPGGRKRGGKTPAPTRQRPPAAAPQDNDEGSSEDLEALADALRPLVERFGTSTGFAAWLESLKRIEDIREKRLKNEEAERTLIQYGPVKQLAFGYIDASQRRVLRDASRTIARRVYAMAKSGESVEEAERTVREILGSTLKPVKRAVLKVLENA